MNDGIKTNFRLIVVASIMLACLPVSAQINKWVDEQGRTHYGSQPPADVKVESIKQAPVSTGASVTTVSSQSVILYSTSWCGYCKQARSYMNKNSIAYREYDIEDSLSAKLDYDRAGGQGVPFLVRGRDVLSGFREQSYDRFFNK